jgi:hypothetical protein
MDTLTAKIDKKNYEFTLEIKQYLKINVPKLSEESLAWLMLEHYQFSLRNTSFLYTAAQTAKQLEEKGVQKALMHNYDEETGHDAIYKKALGKIGIDIEKRVKFKSTTQFFDKIQSLISTDPSYALGTIYATETAAIFEHEVFKDMSLELINRRNLDIERGVDLIAFYDLHLDGVEQAHKDDLGQYVNMQQTASGESQIQKIETGKLETAALEAIDAMIVWWNDLLSEVKKISESAETQILQVTRPQRG